MKPLDEPTGSKLAVTKTSSTSVDLHWRGESDVYTVTIVDLKTSAVVRSFVTSDTNATIGELTSGQEYRISVDGSSYVIVEDIVM